ncbi:MAG: hypothetical protein ABI333_27135 [bacterium]
MIKLVNRRQLQALVHALVGWMLCGSLIGIGRIVTSMENTLILHAAGVPVAIALIAWHYFRRFPDASVPVTATLFTGLPIALDLLLVAPLVEGNFEMFASALGTWIPLASIFVTTCVVGLLLRRRSHERYPAEA